MSATFLRGATLLHLDPLGVEPGHVRVARGLIDAVGPTIEPGDDDRVVDLGGRVVMPGLVVGHHHLYSALARGMPAPDEAPVDFHDTLRKVWWRLDRCLTPDDVELSGWVGLLDAVSCGVTCVVDHHASPAAVEGVLDRLAAPFERLGVRGVLCYEVSDRDGRDVRDAGVAENERFAAARASSAAGGRGAGLLAAATGAHASFTVSDETLRSLGGVVERTGAPLHVHLLEDPVDRELSVERWGRDPVARLRDHGLVDGAVLVHGIHLDDGEVAAVVDGGATLVHNPRSNVNNRVGYARPWRFGPEAALGTDGMDGDPLAEARAAFLAARDAGHGDPAGLAVSLLVGAQRLAARLTGRPLGRIVPGACADLAILRYDPPTPLHAGNAVGHLLFGMSSRHVESVMVDGRFVMRAGQVFRVQAEELLDQARQAAHDLWERMASTPPR